MNKIKAVVFDIGGVLCDWMSICYQLAEEAKVGMHQFLPVFLKLSFDPKSGSDLGYMTMDEFAVKLTAALGIPEKAVDWRHRFIPGFKRIEPSYQLLEELKGKYRLAALTNAKLGLWDEWQTGQLRKYFPLMIDSSQVHILKPDPRIFEILLRRLSLPAEECLFIDDDSKNTVAAEKLGFKTVHFKEPEKSVKLIRKILYGTV